MWSWNYNVGRNYTPFAVKSFKSKSKKAMNPGVSLFKKVMFESLISVLASLSTLSVHAELKECLVQIKVYYLLIKPLLQGKRYFPAFIGDNILLLCNFYLNAELLTPNTLCTYRSRQFRKSEKQFC